MTGGGWGDLRAILTEARLLGHIPYRPRSCPNDGEPLRTGPHGILYCPFDGWSGGYGQATTAPAANSSQTGYGQGGWGASPYGG